MNSRKWKEPKYKFSTPTRSNWHPWHPQHKRPYSKGKKVNTAFLSHKRRRQFLTFSGEKKSDLPILNWRYRIFFTPPPIISTHIGNWHPRECVRILDLRVQVHPGEIWVSKQRVHIVLEASKLAGAKGDSEKFLKFFCLNFYFQKICEHSWVFSKQNKTQIKKIWHFNSSKVFNLFYFYFSNFC